MRVVIPAAGKGTRLGLGIPKALVPILGVPLIQWQLEALKDEKDVVVVVGYKGEEVADIVYKYDKKVVWNYTYETTGVSYSVGLGCQDVTNPILVLDGDVLPTTEGLAPFLSFSGEYLAGIREKQNSSDAIYAVLDKNNNVVNFNRKLGDAEWACVCVASPKIFKLSKEYIFDRLNTVSPVPSTYTDFPEIDTLEERDKAEKWLKTKMKR